MWGGRQLKAYVGGGAAGAAQSLTSGATIHTFTMGQRCRPILAGIMVTTQCTVTPPVVNFTSGGGSTGDCGKITVPIAKAAGQGIFEKTDYNAISSCRWVTTLRRGQQVAVVVATPATAGAGIPILIVEEDPDVPENEASYWTATSN
jgi:hypothetical protein